jgi:hypothetical protein
MSLFRLESMKPEKEMTSYEVGEHRARRGILSYLSGSPKILRPPELLVLTGCDFFLFILNIYDEYSLTPDRTYYNCDETGVSVVPKTRS